MKFKKLIALILAIASVMMVFTSCNKDADTGESSGQTPELENKYIVTAHLKIVDIDGTVIYSTEEEDEEMYKYESPWFEPTVLNFFDDYCFMNDDKLSYKAKDNILKTVTLISKKGNKDYKADATYQVNDTETAMTYWTCLINGAEIEGQFSETMVPNNSEVVIRLTYVGQVLVEE